LAVADLKSAGRVRVRQLFEVIYSDIGLKFVESKVVNSLNGLRVAAYYGCQLVRPESSFDEPRNPQSLNHLLVSLGAEPVTFPLRGCLISKSPIISFIKLKRWIDGN